MSEHMASMSRSPLRLGKFAANVPSSALILDGFALFQVKILRLVCLRRGMVSLFSIVTALWSETPEITFVDFTIEG